MTTYDDIYSYFNNITRVGELDLPSTIEEQCSLIRDGILEFNIRLQQEIEFDDSSETILTELTQLQIRIIAECMKLRVFQNMMEDFISVWEVFQSDLGRRDYKNQVSARELLVERQEKVIRRLVLKVYDQYIDGEQA